MTGFDTKSGWGLRRPERLAGQVFLGADAIAEGLISHSRLRREYRRVLHGVYVPAGTRVDHGVHCLAALLRLGPDVALTGHSAAWWYGVQYADVATPVLVLSPAPVHRSSVRGVKIHHTLIDDSDVQLVDGVRVTSPIRTAWDAAILTDPRSALATIDGLLRARALSADELDSRLLRETGRWGVARARAVFELADECAESPAESWTRWILHQAKIPPPVLQFRVLDEDGRFVARADFAWPDCKVILEYDGQYHDDELQRRRDRRRQAWLRELGWEVIRMTSEDLRDPSSILAQLRRALTG